MPTGGGGGGGGLSSVITDSTLTGSGTSGSHLGVNQWPVNYFSWQYYAAESALSGNNHVDVSGFTLSAQLTFSNLVINIGTADAVGLYDFGIYSKAGALLANVGPASYAGTGQTVLTVLQAPVTLAPGLYVFGFTGTSTTLKIGSSPYGTTWIGANNVATSSAGTLPVSIGAQAISISNDAWAFGMY